MTHESIITVKCLSKSLKNQVIFKNLSFTIYTGEVVALLGINGAGKSTLINCLNQLTTPTTGKITLFNSEHTPIKKQQHKIGVMLQQDIALENVTVKEFIQLAQTYYSNPLSYHQLIHLANLKKLENNKLTTLSGGERRRLSFAITMVGDPELIFLDEPTAGMDSYSRNIFWQQISHYQTQGKTFLITSHYLEELDGIAQRLLILKDGGLAFNGTIKDLRKDSGQTEIIFQSSLNQTIFSKLAAVKTCQHQQDTYILVTDQINDFIHNLLPYLEDINHLQIQPRSLESLFYDINQKGEKK